VQACDRSPLRRRSSRLLRTDDHLEPRAQPGTLCAHDEVSLALVTGASESARRSHSACARRCAGDAPRASNCTEVADAIRAEGGRAYPVDLDVADP
jgi:hypothetical protein